MRSQTHFDAQLADWKEGWKKREKMNALELSVLIFFSKKLNFILETYSYYQFFLSCLLYQIFWKFHFMAGRFCFVLSSAELKVAWNLDKRNSHKDKAKNVWAEYTSDCFETIFYFFPIHIKLHSIYLRRYSSVYMVISWRKQREIWRILNILMYDTKRFLKTEWKYNINLWKLKKNSVKTRVRVYYSIQ